MRKILVLRGGALGDFIVTLPALAALRRRWPDARIELVGNAPAAQLAGSRGLIDAVHSQHEARWSALFGAGPLPQELATWLATFDLVMNYWPDPDGAIARRFPRRSEQAFLTADAHPAQAPAAAHYCVPLRALGVEAESHFHLLATSGVERGLPSPSISPPAYPPSQRRSQVTPPYVFAVHPGSGSPKKNWPLENWLAVIATLPGRVLLILGAAEIERWSALTSARLVRGVSEQRVGGKTVHLAVDLPLDDLVTQLSTCRLFFGHDSGISHLAAACGVPSLLLFGPTDPAMWAPPAPHVRVIKCGETLTSISVGHVTAALRSSAML